jgi:DNA (cytosine-5)-methyltransferase 1
MTTSVYYNDNDSFSCQWLKNLAEAKSITPGDIDGRSIKDIRSGELDGYRQIHLFAGIGGWSYALSLAGWPNDRPVLTGSCPCQPFSSAGKGDGADDPRHLWPEMLRIITELHPPTIFGEQVAGAIGHGWLDGVFDDLEGEGYACGAAVLPACSVGAPHLRQRLFWVAKSSSQRHTYQQTSEGDVQFGRQSRNTGPASPWNDYEWASCSNEKHRRIKSGLVPLVTRVPGRVAQLRGIGNSIVPQVAAKFIYASMR